VVSEHQEVKAHLLEVLGREGDDRRGLSTVAEAAAEGCSSARRFPARRRAKLGLESCIKARGS
jgi:hypothetical protein